MTALRRVWLAGCAASALFAMSAPADVTVTPITGPSDAPSAPAATPVPGAPAGPTLPTPADAKSLVDARKYPEALRILARLLDLKGPTVNFDRQEMLILKAECDLQIHQPVAAVSALALAIKEAAAGGSDKTEMNARAFTDLIQKSPRSLYLPQSGADRSPINILERDKRKTAYNALFTDTFAVLEVKYRAARAADTLGPMIDIAKELLNIRADEYMGTDGTAATTAFSKDLASSMSRLITAALTTLDGRVNRISASANRLIIDNLSNGAIPSQTSYHHAGLTATDKNDLQDIVKTAETVRTILVDFNKAFGTVDIFRANLNRVDVIEERVKEVLNKDYVHV